MELADIRERILKTPLIRQLPEAMKPRIAMILLWVSKTQEIQREDKIFKQGQRDTGTGCIILEGMVRIITEESDKKTVEAPDILGEVQLFTPDGVRTATVQVVVGGEILTFSWTDFGKAARQFFDEEEMETLKKAITECAWMRQKNLLERLRAQAK